MEIISIELENHKILGNLKLDFLKSDGTHAKNIVFAGQNGSGKTTILKVLSELPNILLKQNEFNLDIVCNLNNDETTLLKSIIKNAPDYPEYSIRVKSARNNQNVKLFINEETQVTPYGNFYSVFGELFYNIYSKSEANFIADQTSSVTTMNIDVKNDSNKDRWNYLATNVKQLLIDVEALDNADFRRKYEENKRDDYQLNDTQPRLYRFNSAFQQIFNDELKYIGQESINNSLDVIFEKFEKKISINDLSSGEKQIVFRGVYILKDKSALKEKPVIIDEPEISMHPKWQDKIFNYYCSLFTDTTGNQTSQLFISTHSEHVLFSALDNSNTLIIKFASNRGVITSEKVISPTILPRLTFAETQFKIFNIYSTDYHNQLYCFMQDIKRKSTLKSADSFILSTSSFNPSLHTKPSSYLSNNWQTLPTYIRNAINHNSHSTPISEDELKRSTDLLINILS